MEQLNMMSWKCHILILYRTLNNQSVSIDFHFPVFIQFKILYVFLCDILHFVTAFPLIEHRKNSTILSLIPWQINLSDSFFRFFISDISNFHRFESSLFSRYSKFKDKVSLKQHFSKNITVSKTGVYAVC